MKTMEASDLLFRIAVNVSTDREGDMDVDRAREDVQLAADQAFGVYVMYDAIGSLNGPQVDMLVIEVAGNTHDRDKVHAFAGALLKLLNQEVVNVYEQVTQHTLYVNDGPKEETMSLFHAHGNANKFHEAVERCLTAVTPILGDIEAIAVRGASGMTVGGVLAYIVKKPLIVIRKKGESVHVNSVHTGNVPCERGKILWLDDFVASGHTYKAVIEALGEVPAYSLLYSQDYFNSVPLGEAPFTGKYNLRLVDGERILYRPVDGMGPDVPATGEYGDEE